MKKPIATVTLSAAIIFLSSCSGMGGKKPYREALRITERATRDFKNAQTEEEFIEIYYDTMKKIDYFKEKHADTDIKLTEKEEDELELATEKAARIMQASADRLDIDLNNYDKLFY